MASLSSRLNRGFAAEGRLKVLQARVSNLPNPDDYFDFATAFETIYFWPNLEKDFPEVNRVLNPAGFS